MALSRSSIPDPIFVCFVGTIGMSHLAFQIIWSSISQVNNLAKVPRLLSIPNCADMKVS